MSEMRIGIIAEGKTDLELIRQLLQSIFLNKDLTVSYLSPSSEELGRGYKPEGFGWGGVYRVCKSLYEKLEESNAYGITYDLIVIHLDGDVMFKTYTSAGIQMDDIDPVLPCYMEHGDLTENCALLSDVIRKWLGEVRNPTASCIPYINSDLWVAYALYPQHRKSLREEMSEEELISFLMRRNDQEGRLIRKKKDGYKKNYSVYVTAVERITCKTFEDMCKSFSQAKRFYDECMENAV